jgi:lipopolysaccharide transport system permease protein
MTLTREPFVVLAHHRRLTMELAKREITDRYSGQFLGILWAIGHPLIMIAVYVFVFGGVFKIRIGGTAEMPLDYITYLLSGVIPWLAFQESMAKSSTIIVSNANLVKQVVFPIEVLPAKGAISSLITQGLFLMLLTIYVATTQAFVPWTYLLIPLLLVVQLMAMIGIGYLLAAIGVYFRDVKDFVQVFGTVGVYLMPVFYLPQFVPAVFRQWLYVNPFSHLIWCYQDSLYFGRFEHPWAWLVWFAFSVSVWIGGYRVFRRLKVMFSNAL